MRIIKTTKLIIGDKLPKKDCKDVIWSYNKEKNSPNTWKSLCSEFSDCGGKYQSPINIIIKKLVLNSKLSPIKLKYENSVINNIIKNNNILRFNIIGNNILTLGKKDYKLIQFHYHSPSEHTIDNEKFPLEIHFVHKYSDSDFVVLGIIFIEGKENIFFNKYLSDFPITNGEYKLKNRINLQKLIPENKSYYHYTGSLTTPPCSEIVSWYLLKEPMEASKKQLNKISKILNKNNRPIQALNNRRVKLYEE